MTINDLQLLKDQIINELRDIMPDIHVDICAADSNVHLIKTKTMSGNDYYPYGQRAYIGMVQATIWVYWDKFYDRICGNGWMYGQDALFKFDIKDGDCKYYDQPTFIQDYIPKWIDKMKKEHAELQANYNALPA